MADRFILKADYAPTGDQPEAIEALAEGLRRGDRDQTLIGVTGSGKTFTMANVIARANRPAIIIEPNKTLAAQICSEMKALFPENAVEFFVSYYDYYQPEAYVPGKDIYIEKDSAVNNEIDKLRHSATSSLFERRDVIIVASVSCIYSLGDPQEYAAQILSIRRGAVYPRDDIIKRLVTLQYSRSDLGFERNNFRVRGDTLEIFPSNTDTDAVRVELFGDEVERISQINTVTGEVVADLSHIAIYPATHYMTNSETRKKALEEIIRELDERIAYFESENRLLEAQRLEQRTRYDLEMMREIGSCKGIENYSRHIVGNPPGAKPYTLIDYFPKDFLVVIDESHVMLPQLRAMAHGDRSRKTALVDYGFRLPSALDNRPLRFEEFDAMINQAIFISATPAAYEREVSGGISAEQVIRPTGLLDPPIEIVPTEGQIDHLIGEIHKEVDKGHRVLVTTLTKKMAENLTEYLKNAGLKVRYMHSEVDTLERNEILRDLRLGVFDTLVGINLLREGLDLPEVALVAILDADKEGFLRTETSLIQTIGRAARNAEGRVIMYADTISPAMRTALDETERRRSIQMKYNEEHGITPETIKKAVRDVIEVTQKVEEDLDSYEGKSVLELTKRELTDYAKKLEKEMKAAAKDLQFERAAILRDKLLEVRAKL